MRVVIVGAAGQARETAWYLDEINHVAETFQLAGFVVSDLSRLSARDSRDRVLGDYAWLDEHGREVDGIILGVSTPGSRLAIASDLEGRFPWLDWPAVVHPSVRIDSVTSKLGRGDPPRSERLRDRERRTRRLLHAELCEHTGSRDAHRSRERHQSWRKSLGWRRSGGWRAGRCRIRYLAVYPHRRAGDCRCRRRRDEGRARREHCRRHPRARSRGQRKPKARKPVVRSLTPRTFPPSRPPVSAPRTARSRPHSPS